MFISHDKWTLANETSNCIFEYNLIQISHHTCSKQYNLYYFKRKMISIQLFIRF